MGASELPAKSHFGTSEQNVVAGTFATINNLIVRMLATGGGRGANWIAMIRNARLYLANIMITNDEFEALSIALRHIRCYELTLINCEFNARALAELIRGDHDLKKLSIFHCNFINSNINPILDALTFNRTFTSLNIGTHELDVEAAEKLIVALRENAMLKHIQIRIDDIALPSFARQLSNGIRLETLDIATPAVSHDATIALGKYIAKNNSLHTFILHTEDIDRNDIKLLKALLNRMSNIVEYLIHRLL